MKFRPVPKHDKVSTFVPVPKHDIATKEGEKMAVLTLETKKYAIKIENFEGPLDLLCHLIDKNKMNIYDNRTIY